MLCNGEFVVLTDSPCIRAIQAACIDTGPLKSLWHVQYVVPSLSRCPVTASDMESPDSAKPLAIQTAPAAESVRAADKSISPKKLALKQEESLPSASPVSCQVWHQINMPYIKGPCGMAVLDLLGQPPWLTSLARYGFTCTAQIVLASRSWRWGRACMR